MKITLIFLFILGQLLAHGQVSNADLPYLIIPPHALPDRFKEFEKQQVHKIVLKGCAKQKGYQVIIGDPPSHKKTKWQMYRVDLDIKFDEVNRTFNVKASLIEVRNGKIFNSITETNIQELEFFRRLEVIIDRLFLPSIMSGDDLETDNSASKEKNKKEIPNPLPPEAKVANLNFRERVMDMRNEVNLALANASRAIREKKEDSGKDQDANKKKPAAASGASGALDGNALGAEVPKPKKPAPPIDVGHSIRVGYYTFTTNSKHLVETDSFPKYLMADYEYARPWKKDSDFYHHVNLRYGKVLNKEEKAFAPYTGLGLWEGYHFIKLNWMPKLGLEMDTLSFKNLPVSGQGLKIANNQIFWFTVSSVNNFTLFNRPFRIAASYGKPLKVMSDYSAMKNKSLTGSKMNFTLSALNVYKKFHVELNYFMSDLSADTVDKPLTFSTTGVGFNAFYNF